MRLIKLGFLLPLVISFGVARAEVADEVGFGIGMAMASFAEQETSLEGENIEEPASGSISTISSSLYYKFFHRPKYDLYLGAAFPLMGGGDASFISAGLGMEYYFTSESHRLKENNDGFNLYLNPKLRYYAIGEINIIYLSYLTETRQKNDVNIELAAGGGLSYSLSDNWKNWGLRGSAVVGRGLGVLTSTFNVRVFGSIIYFLEI